jgi:exodeoxyribonuclease VII large subunit
VLILARGGGSIEDLWAFNDELVARQLAELVTPLVTGIGHEIDTTIADFVADYRAATPTAAAQSVVRDFREVLAEMRQIRTALLRLITQRLQKSNLKLMPLTDHPLWTNPELLTQESAFNLTMLTQRLLNFGTIVKPKVMFLNQLQQRLHLNALQRIHGETSGVDRHSQRLMSGITQRLTRDKSDFASRINLLNAYSPLNVLERGYAVASQDQITIRSINQVSLLDQISVRLIDGVMTATVIGKEPYGKK